MGGLTGEEKRLSDAVDWFAEQMKEKLIRKSTNGWRGWREESYIKRKNLRQIESHAQRILEHGDPQEVDLANLCMFRAFFRHTREDLMRREGAK